MNYRVLTDKTQWEIFEGFSHNLYVKFFEPPNIIIHRIHCGSRNYNLKLDKESGMYMNIERYADNPKTNKVKALTQYIPTFTSDQHFRRVFWRWIPVNFRFDIHQALAMKTLQGNGIARKLLDADREFLKPLSNDHD